jgi:plastocyanin
MRGKPARRVRAATDDRPSLSHEDGGNNRRSIMQNRLTLPRLAVLALAVAGPLGAATVASAAATQGSTLVIRHQLRGCHTWSANGDSFKAAQAITLHRGGAITVTNNDVMSHKLIETSGPAVTYKRVSTGMGMGLKGTFPAAMLARMGSSSTLTFRKAGVYKFTTKPGEDFMAGIKTVGADNVLRLTVTVS